MPTYHPPRYLAGTNLDAIFLHERDIEAGCTNPIPCDTDPACPPGCPQGSCFRIVRTCNTCPRTECQTSSGGGGGVNPGVIAGPIIGVVLLIASLGLFWWLRRKKQRDLARLEDLANRARKGESSAFHLSQPSSPVTTSHRHRSGQSGPINPRSPTSSQGTGTSSQRLPNATAEGQYRDADGNIIRVYTGKRGAINADPNHPDNGGAGDPFGDQNSLQTDRADSGHSTNVVPIHYVPGTAAEAMALRSGQNANPMQQAAAARTLDQARQNLWKPRQPPQRPARAPDLDLRLNSQNGQAPFMQEVAHNDSRDSFISALSTTPSYLSGATGDLHIDVPKIMTRQQVHVGRLQAAEVVQFGARNMVPEESASPHSPSGSDPFKERNTELLDQSAEVAAGSTGGAPHSGGAAAASVTSLDSRRFDDEGNMSHPSPTDLRFSMGSLAYDRASVSTVGTASHSVHRGQFLAPPDQPPVPSLPAGYAQRPRYESVSSYKSTGNDSLLGSFPMIPPAAGSSTNLSAQPGAAPPPVSYKGPGAGAGPSGRPLTANSAHSVADSFLGRFPFVPPNVDADGASLNGMNTQQPAASASRLTLGSVSEGLGLNDFDFEFEHPPMPSLPGASQRESTGGSATGSDDTGDTVRPGAK